MKILRITIKGHIAFPEETTIILPDAKKIAFIGDNGSGKTSAMDTVAMALYGSVPTRISANGNDKGTIYEAFPSREGLVEVELQSGGNRIIARRLIDGPKRKQTVYLYVNGDPITEGKSAEFEEAVFKYTGLTEGLFMAAVYNAQNGKGNILSLDDKGARNLLTDLLDLRDFDEPFSKIAEECKLIDSEISTLKDRIRTISDGIGDPAELKAEQQSALNSKTEIERSINKAETDHAAVQNKIAAVQAQVSDLQELQTRVKNLNQEIHEEGLIVIERNERIRKNKTELLDRKNQILEATATIEESQKKMQIIRSDIDSMQASIDQKTNEHQSNMDRLFSDRESLRTTIEEVEKKNRQKKSTTEKIHGEINKRKSILETLHKQAEPIERVPCSGEMAESCELLSSARDARERISVIESEISQLEKQLESPEYIEDPVDTAAFMAIQEAITDLTADGPGTVSLRSEMIAKKSELAEIENRIKESSALAALMPQLEGAEERVQSYQHDIEQAERKIHTATEARDKYETQISAFSDQVTVLEKLNAEAGEKKSSIKLLSETRDSLTAKIGELSARIQTISETESRISGMKKDLSSAEKRSRVLNDLREALGPKGAPALVIDAAGPAIEEAVNSLLSEYYGSRFQVRFKTQRETKKGDARERIDITVIDNEKENETLIQNKSGGEAAIIREAISMGLAVFKRNRNSADIRTLMRDETDGGLTSENAHIYQKILDRAMKDGGFEQVIFVSHKPEIQEVADSRIRFKRGHAPEILDAA